MKLMAVLIEDNPGLWLPAMRSLNCGMVLKKSWFMKRASMGLLPVICLIAT